MASSAWGLEKFHRTLNEKTLFSQRKGLPFNVVECVCVCVYSIVCVCVYSIVCVCVCVCVCAASVDTHSGILPIRPSLFVLLQWILSCSYAQGARVATWRR